MSVRYRIHRNLQIVHTVVSDTTNSQELRALSERVRRHPDFDPSFDQVVEISCEGQSPNDAFAAQVCSHLVPPAPRVKLALVAPGNLEFGIARQFQSIYELPDEVFFVARSLEGALAWLGLEGDVPEWGEWATVSP